MIGQIILHCKITDEIGHSGGHSCSNLSGLPESEEQLTAGAAPQHGSIPGDVHDPLV